MNEEESSKKGRESQIWSAASDVIISLIDSENRQDWFSEQMGMPGVDDRDNLIGWTNAFETEFRRVLPFFKNKSKKDKDFEKELEELKKLMTIIGNNINYLKSGLKVLDPTFEPRIQKRLTKATELLRDMNHECGLYFPEKESFQKGSGIKGGM